MKRIVFILLICSLTLSLTACASKGEDTNKYKAKIKAVIDESYEQDGKFYSEQQLTLEFLEGPYAGQSFETNVFIDAANYNDIALYRAGDTVIAAVFEDEYDEVSHVSVMTLYRVPYVIVLAVLFLVLIAIIGRIKGLKTILALVFTICAVVFVLVPLIANGYNPILSAALVCIIISIVTLLAIGGFTKKSLAAILGTIGGLICAGVITLIFSSLMRISGIDTGEVELLMVADTDVILNYQGILTAGILIGCIGAVMDVGMSITSAMSELVTVNPTISRQSLYRSGIAVGKDIIGTMANTLILAYTGGSIMLMVVWSVYEVSFVDMLNKGFIVLEVAKSLCGSIGMVMSIPLTAFIASHLVRMDFRHHDNAHEETPAIEEIEVPSEE